MIKAPNLVVTTKKVKIAFTLTVTLSTLCDYIGRKRGALIGYYIVITSSFVTAVSPSIDFLIVCRFIQGTLTSVPIFDLSDIVYQELYYLKTIFQFDRINP
jgi:MFS family permease